MNLRRGVAAAAEGGNCEILLLGSLLELGSSPQVGGTGEKPRKFAPMARAGCLRVGTGLSLVQMGSGVTDRERETGERVRESLRGETGIESYGKKGRLWSESDPQDVTSEECDRPRGLAERPGEEEEFLTLGEENPPPKGALKLPPPLRGLVSGSLDLEEKNTIVNLLLAILSEKNFIA